MSDCTRMRTDCINILTKTAELAAVVNFSVDA